MHIEIQDAVDCAHLPTQEKIEKWLAEAEKNLPDKNNLDDMELTIRIIDKDESAYLNSTYRHKKGPTNVLSFPDTPLPGFLADSLGDLAICADLVAEEAQEQQKSVEAHWAHLIIHGFLHLLGYDHEKDDEAEIMENLEIQILQNLGFKNPY